MTDLDRLLRPDISHAAADAVQPPDFTPIQRRGIQRRRTRTLLAFAAAALIVVAGVAGSLRVLGTGEAAPPTPIDQPPPLSMPTGDAPIEPGTYLITRTAWSAADFTVTFPQGWSVQYGSVYLKHQDRPEELGLRPYVVDEIFTDPCLDGSTPQKVGPRPQDLVDALLEQKGSVASDPLETTLGGYPATRVDLTTPKRIQGCRMLEDDVGLQLWYSQPADDYFVLLPDGVASIYMLDVGGERQVFTAQYRSRTSTEDRAELQQVLKSIHIEPQP